MYDLRHLIGIWIQRAKARALLPVVLALLLGLTVGLALRPWLQVSVIGSGADDLTSKLKNTGAQYPKLDLGFFATVELALRSIKSKDGHEPDLGLLPTEKPARRTIRSKDSHEPVLCLALVGMVEGEVSTDAPPTIPEFMLNWIRDYYPSIVALPECVESWGSLAEIQLKTIYEDAHLVIVGYPQWVYPSFVKVTINRVVPGDIHTYGSSYLLRFTSSGVIWIDQDEFRSYH